MRRALVIALCLAALPALGEERFDDVRRELTTRFPDWNRAAGNPEFPTLLNRAWTAVGGAAAAFLRAKPDAAPRELADAIVQLNRGRKVDDYTLSASAVQLGPGLYAVAASFPRSGTFFVVTRDGVRWSIKDLAARHYARRDEIGKWAWIGFPWGDGPLTGDVALLPPSRGGHPRFYVDAKSSPLGGGTWPDQICIWEWDGRAAVPLLVRAYSVSYETGPNAMSGDVLTIPTKGEFKRFYSCGGCPEPEVAWRLQITPDGVRDLGRQPKVPELELCDELFDRVIRRRSTRDIAAPQAAAALRGIMDSDRGMLGNWHVESAGARRVLELTAENINCATVRLEMEPRARGLYVTDARVTRTCK